MTSAQRRPRRAVRPPGTVGGDESVLRAVLPAPAEGSPAPAAVSGGRSRVASDPDDPWRATRSADDSDHGWGREEPSSNDERLRREKPPHW